VGLPYDPHEIEERWADAVAAPPVDLSSDRLFYSLVEFPYPSADGLHIGHVFKYSGVDVLGRYLRMTGREVWQPIGFDAFGIHTENFALKMGEHPMTLTARTTENFRRQLSNAGIAWDWSRCVDTSRPEYYRWTQWLLVRMFEAGLMYQAEAPVTWCPSCKTVLAREQTENGGTTCERCQSVVTARVMRQWFLRITRFADRLLDGLDQLDWPERAKRLQRQWIGRSEGREIDFGELTVFTTRPDTIDSVTFVAVHPGHPVAGSTVPHPLTGADLPVVEADYVLAGYGTGAVMGVPAYDDRDRRFAEEHGLPIVELPVRDVEIGRPAVRYRQRDWLISRQRYWGPPIPIVHCESCGPVAVPEDHLPVELPMIEDFRPTGTGVSPLAACDEWVRTTCPACGAPARRETDVSDTFVDSSWYFLRYAASDRHDVPWDVAMRPDFYAGGPEHVQRHHLYARFVTMALHDMGLVPFEEPFPKIRLGGLITRDGAKMSKSRGNVVGPDDYVPAHGRDVLRCHLLFTGPWESEGEVTDDGIVGIERFFTKLWRRIERGQTDGTVAPGPVVGRVELAIERMRFNVGLAVLMEHVDSLDLRTLTLLLAPFAPHLAQELWHRLGGEGSVHGQQWPESEEEPEVTVVVQVDGKVRDRVTAPLGATADEVLARSSVEAQGRVIHVPDRLVNVVTR
jgi:leucyl-tRNA synthetase